MAPKVGTHKPHTTLNLPELLAPAGSLEKLRTAIHYGADAVYMGGADYSLRAHAVMERDDLSQAVSYAHQKGVQAYITVNIFAHNQALEGLPDYLHFLSEIKADGLIIADPGIVRLAQKLVPNLPIHLSTQANTTNPSAALFWQEQGVKRINLARELSLEEMRAIRNAVDLSLEVFVHGAICISYSGRCSLSLYMTGRDANCGNCAHPCRYRYVLEEEKRPGHYFPVEEDDHGTYIFNSKDLCLLNRLPELVAAGMDSLKLEGRMKSVYYVGAIVRLYRAALDSVGAVLQKHGQDGLATMQLESSFLEELPKIGSRSYTENFLDGPPTAGDMLYEGITVKQTHAPVGIVRKEGTTPLIETRNPIEVGDTVEFLARDFSNHPVQIRAMTSEDGTPLQRANPGNRILLTTEPAIDVWKELGLLRRKKAD